MLVDEGRGAMSQDRVALLDLLGLRERFLVVPAHEAGGHGVVLHEPEARLYVIRIELHRTFVFLTRFPGQSWLFEDTGFLREVPVRVAEQVMRLGAVGILRHRSLQKVHGAFRLPSSERGAT